MPSATIFDGDLSFKFDCHMIMQCIKIDKPIVNYIF